MPNHVSHRMTVIGSADDVAAFIDKHITRGTGGRALDFNTVIPMPPIVANTESSTDAEYGIYCLTGRYRAGSPLDYPWVKKLGITTRDGFREWLERERPDAMDKGARSLAALDATGFASWYEWSISNWGTKWNAYETKIDDSGNDPVVLFQTAWSVPEPVLLKMSADWPSLSFAVIAFDEGWCFAYDAVLRKGKIVSGGKTKATPTLYEAVYGEPPDLCDDDGE